MPSPPRRRLFQFGLRQLMTSTALAASALALWRLLEWVLFNTQAGELWFVAIATIIFCGMGGCALASIGVLFGYGRKSALIGGALGLFALFYLMILSA
jgi:hypothetical protein